MRIIGIFLAGCVAIAALRLVVTAVALFAMAALVWTLYFKPVQVLCFIAMCAALRLLETQPMLVAGLVTAVIITGRISRLDSTKTES